MKLSLTKNQETLFNLLKDGFVLTKASHPRQVYKRIIEIKNKGYNVERMDIIENGTTKYKLKTILEEYPNKILYTYPETTEFRALVISDTHLGNSLQRIDVLNSIYEYCIKNNIHIILNCGDFVEGIDKTSYGKLIDKDFITQITNALKNHPYDKNIINLLLLGNHDKSYLEKHYIDLQKIIIDNRHDILPLGYNQANIDVKNDTIALLHPNNNEKYQLEDKIVFRGHSHQSKQKIDAGGNKILIYVPTCSSIFHNRDYCYPSILDVNFEFSANGLIKEMNISTLIYNNGFIKTNEFQKTFGIIKKALEIKNQL